LQYLKPNSLKLSNSDSFFYWYMDKKKAVTRTQQLHIDFNINLIEE